MMADATNTDERPSEDQDSRDPEDGKGTKRNADEEERVERTTECQIPTNKKQKFRNKHIDPNILKVRRTIQLCCARNDLATAMEAYDNAIIENVRIEAQTFYNLLNLCDGIGERGIHIGTPKPREEDYLEVEKSDHLEVEKSDHLEVEKSDHLEVKKSDHLEVDKSDQSPKVRSVDVETRKAHAFVLKNRMDELKIALNETAFSALVKILSRVKDFGEAENILMEAEKVQQCRPRLRLYSSLLIAYCEAGEMNPALRLWRRLSELDITLTEREYLALMRCATTVGNAVVAERVLSEIAEDVLVPSHDTVEAIISWFRSAHAVTTLKDDTSTECVSSLPAETNLPVSDAPSMGPVLCSGLEWDISSPCLVDCKTGILVSGCLQGYKLNPVTVSQKVWDEMKEMNETIVLSGKMEQDVSEYQGGRKGSKRKVGQTDLQERAGHWKRFVDYLEKRERHDHEGTHLDVVIDGANVGYFEQNFSGAPKHVDYNQIDWIVRQFLSMNKSVLLVLHERHFHPKLMPRWALPIVSSWDYAGLLYRTPTGMNDDWFWLHAALWSGRDTLVVTNDEMRDHHFQMLAPRSFLRWKDRHQVHFKFGNWIKGAPHQRRRQVELTYPEVYSRRIQRVEDGLVVPLAKRGDEHRFLDGAHVAADDEPEEETYLCIRPRPLKSVETNGCNKSDDSMTR